MSLFNLVFCYDKWFPKGFFPKGFFPAKRGVRQGDPLSPFLFVIVAKALGRMVNKAALVGLLGGFKVVDAVPLVTHF